MSSILKNIGNNTKGISIIAPYVISYIFVVIVALFYLPADPRLIIGLPLVVGGEIHIMGHIISITAHNIKDIYINRRNILNYEEDDESDDFETKRNPYISKENLVYIGTIILGLLILFV